MLAGLALWRELGDPSATALGLNYISPTAIYLGQLEEAEAFLQESLSLLTEVGDRWGMGTAYRLLGLAALVRGAPGEAQSLIRRSLELFSGFITGWDVLQSLIYLGMATAATGDSAEAQQVFLEALHLAKAVHAAPLTLDIFLALAQLHMQAANVEEALALTLFVMGHPARTQEMKERAGRLYAEAEAQLAPEQICSAIDWAANHSLETIVESLLASI
jgi:tetratricopeptide (TPR) repeat protein